MRQATRSIALAVLAAISVLAAFYALSAVGDRVPGGPVLRADVDGASVRTQLRGARSGAAFTVAVGTTEVGSFEASAAGAFDGTFRLPAGTRTHGSRVVAVGEDLRGSRTVLVGTPIADTSPADTLASPAAAGVIAAAASIACLTLLLKGGSRPRRRRHGRAWREVPRLDTRGFNPKAARNGVG